MASPTFHQPHLNTSRPYSPSLRQRTRSPGVTTGSATQTLTNTPQRSESPEPLILRLRGAHHTAQPTVAIDDDDNTSPSSRQRRHIQWAEDVIDNEGLGRKKSKVCCIYHKPRPVGESSDESSSDSSSSSDDDSDSDIGRDGARPVGGGAKGRRQHGHGHRHKHDADGSAKKTARRPSPNAYERMPKHDVKPLSKQPGSTN